MKAFLYHDNCLDGFCAAYVFWLMNQGSDEWTYIPVKYGEEPPTGPFEEVVIADFSYPPEKMQQIVDATSGTVVCLDHHKGAQENVERNYGTRYFGMFNNEKSGASLVAEHYEIECWLIKYIEDRDLWQFKYPITKQINAAFYSMGFNFEAWRWLHMQPMNDIIMMGESIIRQQNILVSLAVSKAKPVTLIRDPAAICMAVCSSVHQSEIGHALCNAGADVAVIYTVDTNGEYLCSLRSNGYDVSALAKAHGGGGHVRAAGCPQKVWL